MSSSWTVENCRGSTGYSSSPWPGACSVNCNLINPFGDILCSLKVFLVSNKEQKQSLFSAFGRNVMEFTLWSYVCTFTERAGGVEDLYTFCNIFKCSNRIQSCDRHMTSFRKTDFKMLVFFSIEKKKNKAVVSWHTNTIMTKCHNCSSVNNELGKK